MGETTVCQQQQQHRPRGKRVALQESWSPAVGQRCARCVCVRACAAHLPPPPSARGRKSTFSLDPWRRLNTKLHREKDEVQRWDVTPLSPHHRCPAPQTRWPPHPPLPGRTRRTPLPRLRGAQRGGDQRGVSDGRRWGCHSADGPVVGRGLLWCDEAVSRFVFAERVGAVHDVMLLQPPNYLYGSAAAALIGRSSQQQPHRGLLHRAVSLSLTHTHTHTHTLLIY